MGLGNTISNDDSTDTDKQQDDLSVSYIYIYEGGPRHKKAKPEHSAEAYDLVSDGGLLRTALKNSGQFGDIHGFFSQVATALGPAFRSNDYSDLFEVLMVDDEVLADYLSDNPEVRQAVVERMREDEESGDEAAAQSDD